MWQTVFWGRWRFRYLSPTLCHRCLLGSPAMFVERPFATACHRPFLREPRTPERDLTGADWSPDDIASDVLSAAPLEKRGRQQVPSIRRQRMEARERSASCG